jgi:hypothetical protein
MEFIKKLYHRIVDTLAMTAARVTSYAIKYATKANMGDHARRAGDAGAPSSFQTFLYRVWGFMSYCGGFFFCVLLPAMLVTVAVAFIVTVLAGPVIGYLVSVAVGSAFGIHIVNTQYRFERAHRELEQMFGRMAGPVFA